MRVSDAACSSVMPFFSRCARSVSPSRATLLLLARPSRAVHLSEFAWPAVRPDDAAPLHDVDEPAGAREADRHLSLQHRDRRLAFVADDLDRLFVALVVDVLTVGLASGQAVRALDDLRMAVVRGPALQRPVAADELDLVVRHEDALRADRLREVGPQHEHVATSEELLRT